jgi:hypothetical protein
MPSRAANAWMPSPPGLPAVAGDGVITVTPPPYRFDLALEET